MNPPRVTKNNRMARARDRGYNHNPHFQHTVNRRAYPGGSHTLNTITYPNSLINGVNSGSNTTSPSSRLSLKQASQVVAKNVQFYRSGDPHPQSIKVAITKRNFRTFDALLETLSDKVPLPFGVRTISTPHGTHGINRLEEFEDGKAYVCSDRKTVKPIDLDNIQNTKPPWFISKPKTRNRRMAALARQSEPINLELRLPLRMTQVKTPKKVVIVKNGDPTFRHSILLSRRTPLNFEQIMDDIGEIFRMKANRLYTPTGRKLESLQDMFMGPNLCIVTGRESFIAMDYRLRKNKKGDSSTATTGESSDAGVSSGTERMPREQKKTKGRWRVSVSTSELPAAGTDSGVYITLYGGKASSNPIQLVNGSSPSGNCISLNKDNGKKLFMSGNEDEFAINVGFIGDLKKIRIHHDNLGKSSPGWLCDSVVLTDLNTGEVLQFPFNRWLSRDEDDGEICRELPVIHNEEAVLPVLRYIVTVTTGDLWNAGTDARVYITLYGAFGDSGTRMLQRSGRSIALHKGSTEVFRFEAVGLGSLSKLVVGHDGIGSGNGWYLERIVIKEDRVGSEEWLFTCNRWLDEAEEDGKIVRELFPDTTSSNVKTRPAPNKSKEIILWEQEKWKFQRGNHIMLISKATNKAIRTKPDASVDALGDVSHPFGVYEIIRRKQTIRVFANVAHPSFHLAIDQNRFIGQGKGGAFCEFAIKIMEDRSISLESCRYPGHHIAVDNMGKPIDTRGQHNLIGRQFIVYVKGCFRNGSIILLNTSPSQALVVTAQGDVMGTGKRTDITDHDMKLSSNLSSVRSPQLAYFRVIKVAESVRMFQCEKNPRQYLRVKDGQCDGMGTGDVYCHFKVQKYKQGGYVTLQSMKHRGVFIGLSSNGKARPTVDTGDTNTQFFPEVIKFGQPRKEEAARWQTPEPSFIEPTEAIPNSTESLQKKIETTKSTQNREDSIIGHEEGDYRVYVTTGNSGTKEVVTIVVYGEKGQTGSITLGKGSDGGVFQCGQTDEFQVNIGNIGSIHKIRIGVEEASSSCDWRLKQVKMKDMTTNEVFRFKFNRWLSRNRDDGDTVRELPLMLESENHNAKMQRYFVQLRTSKDSVQLQNGTQNKKPLVYLCISGLKSDTGRRLLQKRSHNIEKQSQRKLYIPGQTDTFEIEAVNLGDLKKCTLSCATSLHSGSQTSSATSVFSLFCDEVIIRESEGSNTEYVFPCKKWLGLKRPGAHAQIALMLKEKREVKPSSSDPTNFQDGDWKIYVTTGAQLSPTTSNIVFAGFGENLTTSGTILLGGGKDGLFAAGTTEKFKVNLSKVKNLQKIRIGHDNEGSNPSWYLESIKLKDLKNNITHNLNVKKWLSLERANHQIFTEIPLIKPGVENLPVFNYQICVYTGSILGSDTDANVYICVYGTNGDSGKRPLHKPINNDMKFQESQMDIFEMEAVNLGELTKIVIGHDGTGHGNGWFLHKVIIKEEEKSSIDYVFFCNRWLDDGQDDGKIEREISVEPFDQSNSDKSYDGEYQVLITSGALTSAKVCPHNLVVTVVVYGEEGKTSEIILNSTTINQSRSVTDQSKTTDVNACFKPNQTDKFKIDIPDIGKIYKIRLSYNEDSGWGPWFVERVILLDHSEEDLVFPCNRFLSTTEDDYETIREIAVERTNEETLKSILYHITVYTGDRYGAETDALPHILLKGERGDSGRRWLKQSAGEFIPFQRSSVDVFLIEAVDLGRLTEVVIGHTNKGYGAGWYVEKVTVREGEFASTEWLFPCHAWLDDHIGDCKLVRRLYSLGMISLDGQEEELEHLATPISGEGDSSTMWDVTVVIDDVVTESIVRVHLTAMFYGNGGSSKSDVISLGEWSPGGRKTFKLQTDLAGIGEIYKLRVSIEDYEEMVDVYINRVSIQNVLTKEQFIFAFHRHLRTATGSTCRELPALKVGKNYAKMIRYLVDVAMTSEKPASGILFIKLIGEAGDSGFRTIVKGSQIQHGKSKDGGYTFGLDAVDLGRLTNVAIAYQNDEHEKGFGWNVKFISVQVEELSSFSAGFKQQSTVYVTDVNVLFKTTAISTAIEKEFQLKEELLDDTISYSSRSEVKQEVNVKPLLHGTDGVWRLTLSYTRSIPAKDTSELKTSVLSRLKENCEQIQVFGSTNSSQIFTLSDLDIEVSRTGSNKLNELENVTTNLEIGTSIGQLYSMKIACKHWNSNLVKIKLCESKTKQSYLCHLTAPDHRRAENTPAVELNRIVAALDIPLVRPDIPPLEHHRYKVAVTTGNISAADTDSDVYIKIFGTTGDTGKRLLIKPNSKDTVFAKGQMDVFDIESTDIGEPRKVTVGHNGIGRGKGWFLEDITVTEFRDGKYAEYIFNCFKWLDDSVDDKLTERDLYLTGARINDTKTKQVLTEGNWKCRLKTKEQVLKANENEEPLVHACQFEGNEAEFFVKFPILRQPNVALDGFYKIRIEQVLSIESSKLTTEWPFNELLMTDQSTGEKLRFIFDESPVWEGSGRGQIRELPVARINKSVLQVVDYYVIFYTNVESESTVGQKNIQVQLCGSRGDTGWHRIPSSKDSSHPRFVPGRMDMFAIEAVDLGNINCVKLCIKGDDRIQWKLDKIKVRKGFYADMEHVFDCNRWVGKSSAEKIGQDIVDKIMVSITVPTQDTGTRTSTPVNSTETYQIKTDWKFNFLKDQDKMDDVLLQRSNDKFPLLAVKIYGSKANSDLSLIQIDTLHKIHVTCTTEVIGKETFGEIQKIGVGIEDFSEGNKELWMKKVNTITLSRLTLLNILNNNYCSFRPNFNVYGKSTSQKNKDTAEKLACNWLELIPEWPKQNKTKVLKSVEYEVTFYTGEAEEAGTDADVYIILISDKSDSGKRWLFPREGNDFAKGSQTKFKFLCFEIIDLKQITVGHNGRNATSGWFLNRVIVKASSEPEKQYVFECQKWLADLEDDTFIERTLDLHHINLPETTSDVIDSSKEENKVVSPSSLNQPNQPLVN